MRVCGCAMRLRNRKREQNNENKKKKGAKLTLKKDKRHVSTILLVRHTHENILSDYPEVESVSEREAGEK